MALGAVAEALSAALHKQGLEVSGEEAEHKTVGIQLLPRHCFPSRTQNLLPECVYTVIFEHCVFRDSLALLVFVSKLDFYKNNIWWSCSDFPCSQNYWNDVKKRGSEESWKSQIFSYNFHMQLFYTIKISNAGTHDCMWKGLLIVVNPQRFITKLCSSLTSLGLNMDFFSVRSFTDFFYCLPLCSSNLIFRSMFKAKNLPNNPEMTHEVNDIMHSGAFCFYIF